MTAVAAVRGFNRFYTRQIGVLSEKLLDSAFSLTELRVLYELAHRTDATASELAQDLGLDPGYLSRILKKFEKLAFVSRKPSKTDARCSHLHLTAKGRKAFARLNEDANQDAAAMLGRLSHVDQNRLVESMSTIETLIGGTPDSTYQLRPHRPGDMGAVIELHGRLYSKEYGWDERFEALVAEIASKFITNFDPQRERCWIAERNGAVVGSVFLVKHTEEMAKLRLLIVDPAARGLGIGNHLVSECIQFAKQAGYRGITLWTQGILVAAQHIYQKSGFRLAREEDHCAFGIPMTGQIWELTF